MSDTRTATDPRTGTTLAGRYLIASRVGAGGMATVYRARDELLGRQVAVKIMHPALAHSPELVERFRREATSAARLAHPNIVAVYDSGETDGDLFIVMEFVDGITVRDLLDRYGHFDPPTTRHVVRGVAEALDHAHAQGIVHRDVKPENVIVTPKGDVKVCDFGIAKALGAEAATLTVDRGMGTVAYVAPEQIERGDVDGRADVYALGAVAYEMLTGRPPFAGDTPQAVAAARVYAPVLTPNVSPRIDAAVARATAHRPDDRFETAGGFAAALGDGSAPASLVQTEHLPPSLDTGPMPDAPAPAPSEPRAPWHADAWVGAEAPTETFRPAPPPLPAEETSVLPFQSRLRKRARRRFITGSLLVLALAAAALAGYAAMPKPATVPNLRGQTLQEARATLASSGLELGDTADAVWSDIVPKGTIASTEPKAGAGIEPGAVISVVISKGPPVFPVPDIIGKPVEEARALLRPSEFGLVVDRDEYSDTVPEGAIVSRDPPGATARRGTAFAVVVSKGPELVDVPDIAGLDPEAARDKLHDAGLKYAYTFEFSDAVPEKRVIRADPAHEAPKGSTVTAVVSKGPEPFPMPSLVGLTLDAAKAKAKELGLVVANAYAVPGSGQPQGKVTGQNPPAGTQVKKGTAVDVWYAA